MKSGLLCVDCWPSLSTPTRCQNLNRLPPTPTPVADSCGRSSAESHRIPDCVHTDDPGSRSLKVGVLLKFLAESTRVLKRIPCLSRPSATGKLAAIIEQVASRNDVPSWARLLQFPKGVFAGLREELGDGIWLP